MVQFYYFPFTIYYFLFTNMKTFYITTPIYYANSLPHLGHLYTTLVADTINRYKKQRGYETFFLTGTDEHGINIQRKADENGRTPQEQVDYIAAELKQTFADYGLNYDIFMRTTTSFHYEGVQNLWQRILASKTPKGNPPIYKGFYDAWFCAACAEFKTEKEYRLENDEPVCLVHETRLEKVSEESYFFRLSDYDESLLEIIETSNVVRPEARRNEVVSFIKQGLQDLSISRLRSSVGWGIPVPGDEDHTMYVWMDALSNYWTAILHEKGDQAAKYWENVTHLVGKDILRFHTVYWFSFLIAAGVSVPKQVYAHGMWLDADGRKMGKTLGNVIYLDILRKHFSNDMVRYFCLREMVFGQDGKFGYENLIDRVNSDLAKGLGNLSNRVLTMIRNYCGGAVPDGTIHDATFLNAKRAGVAPDAQEIAKILESARNDYLFHFDQFEFSRALEVLWEALGKIDKFLSDAKPWFLAKDDSQRETLNAVLYRSAEALRWFTVLLNPVMPESTRQIYSQIGLEDELSTLNPENLKYGELKIGTRIGEIKGVFPEIKKEPTMSEIAAEIAEKDQAKAEQPAPERDQDAAEENFITIDDFLKVELRVGEILVAERIPKADKLLRFEIDLGEAAPRQILAGLAEYYDPGTLVGRKVVVVANLKPRKMRGLESQGMICAASLEDGTGEKPALATFIENVDIGARLK
jgi:methionyl-tRNA synthetase